MQLVSAVFCYVVPARSGRIQHQSGTKEGIPEDIVLPRFEEGYPENRLSATTVNNAKPRAKRDEARRRKLMIVRGCSELFIRAMKRLRTGKFNPSEKIAQFKLV